MLPYLPEPVSCPAASGALELALFDNGTGQPPQQATSLHLGWSETALHLNFHCQDPHPHATCTERDGPLWQEDVVEVFLDPTGDGLAYYEIELNPLNTPCDLLLRRSRSGWLKDFRWDCEGLRHEIIRQPDGWQARLQIPFAAITGSSPRPGDQWRANFCRIDYPADGGERELSAWSPAFAASFHRIEQFGLIEFDKTGP